MSLFSANYFKPQFFNAAFLSGVDKYSSKSGHNRLYVYQLQEKEIAKREQEQREAAAEDARQRAQEVARRAAKAKAKQRKARRRSEFDIESLPVPKLKPLYEPMLEDPLNPLLTDFWKIFKELHYTLAPKYDTIKQSLEEAANDTRIRLLLLLAA